MEDIQLITSNVKGYVSPQDLRESSGAMKLIHQALEKRDCPGSDYIGWLHLASGMSAALVKDIQQTAQQIRRNSDVLLVLGIGGSYLGARAALEFLKPTFMNEQPGEKLKIYFAGHNMSAEYLRDLFAVLKGKRVSVNVISKSGTTTETAVVFRLVQKFLQRHYSVRELKNRIICTTDAQKGALRQLAVEQGYKTFVIPDDVGGRFSVLTPVGLLPIACGGVNIRQLLDGAVDFETKTGGMSLEKNIAYRYAAIRHVLYRKGKNIEILSGFYPGFHYVLEWWKQLYGESEGKDGKGIFPAACDFTTDLHSMGQLIQDGPRTLFETFLLLETSSGSMKLPKMPQDLDGLNYLAGREIAYIDRKAYEGTAAAHLEGGVPNMTVVVPERTPYHLGQLFYFFEKAVAMSGLLLGVNPFNQPGVEAYKKKMFQLLGKPGY